MKRTFLIGVGVGGVLGAALVLYRMKRVGMFYRIAIPVAGTSGAMAFAGLWSNDISFIRQMLSTRSGMGQDVGKMVVFGATSIQRLTESLERYNRGESMAVADAWRILQGYRIDEKVIHGFEETWVAEDKRGAVSVVEWANSLTEREYNRLAFVRWLYRKGRLSDVQAEQKNR